MKIKLILILVVVLLLVFVGFTTFTLVKETEEVFYKKDNGEYQQVTVEDTEVPNGSFVKTGESGLAHVILPDESMISLSKSTEMQINYNSSKTSIIQTLGSVWYRVQKIAGKEFIV